MNTKLKLIGAALVALAILPAAVLLFHVNLSHALMGLVTVAGTTVTYQSFQAQGNFGGAITLGGLRRQHWRSPRKCRRWWRKVAMSDTEYHGGDYAQPGDLDGGPGGATAVHPVHLSTPGTIVPLISFALTRRTR